MFYASLSELHFLMRERAWHFIGKPSLSASDFADDVS